MRAMVLCAGFGTRLGGLTRDLPKPLLPVHEHPIIAYILSHLSAQGFREVAINLHFRADLIQDYVGNGRRWNLAVTYSHEPELLGTAGGLKKMAGFFRRERLFLVQYGDILTDQDLGGLVEYHRRHEALATLLLHQRARSNSLVSLDAEGRIQGFIERPTEQMRQGINSPWVNSGICVCHPDILDAIPSDTACDLPRDVFATLAGTGRLFGYPLSGYRCAIDSPERLEEARRALREGRCHIQVPVLSGAPPKNDSGDLTDV
jgi:NDP-sugar pyrophosphorylase family protein